MATKAEARQTRVRLNLELSERVRNRLDELQRISGAASVSEVIRRALALYDLATVERGRGTQLVLVHEDGREERILLLEEVHSETRAPGGSS